MFANDNVIKHLNCNIELFFPLNVESYSKRRLWVWLLCHALDVEHNQQGVEEWLDDGKFSIPKRLTGNLDVLFLY